MTFIVVRPNPSGIRDAQTLAQPNKRLRKMTISIVTAKNIKPNDTILVDGKSYKVIQVILCRDDSVIISLDGHSPCVYFKDETIAVTA